MNKKRIGGLFLISLLVLSVFVGIAYALETATPDSTGFRAAFSKAFTQRAQAADDFYNGLAEFIATPVIQQLFGLFFGIWDPAFFEKVSEAFPAAFGLTKVSGIIIYFVSWLLFLVIFRDILEIATPFESGTNWLVALGLVIVAAQVRLIQVISLFGIGIAATLSAASVWLFLIILIVAFIALLFGSHSLTRISLRLRMAKEASRSGKGAKEAAEGIKGLRTVEKEFRT